MRSTFLPRIYGKIFPQDSGTQVHIKITLDPLIIVLSILLCTTLALGFFLCLGFSIFGYTNSFYLFFGAALVFYYLVVFLGFQSEAQWAEKFITEFFKRHETI